MILHWALTPCASLGSFERYLIAMAHGLSQQGDELTIVVADDLCDEARAAFEAAPLKLVMLPLHQLESPQALLKLTKQIKPKLLHFHFVSFGHALIQAVPALNIRIVLTDHASTTPAEQKLRGLYRSTRRFRQDQINDIDHIIAVSDYVRRRVTEWQNARPSDVSTIYNGIDLKQYQPMEFNHRQGARKHLSSIPPDSFWVGYVGQLTREKGVQTLLNAAQRLSEQKSIHFVIIGDGPLAPQVDKAAKNQGNLSWLGKRSDVAQIMPLFDTLVVPTHMQEAFGLVAAEALACGVPLIVGNVGGLPEVLGNDPLCGTLTLQTSSKHLARDILDMRALPESSNRRHSIRKRAEKWFGLDQQILKTLQVYDDLLSRPVAKSSNQEHNPIS